MPAARAVRTKLLRSPLGLSTWASDQCASYRGRRVLPSVAGHLKLDSFEGAALSHWRHTGDKHAREASTTMAGHYDAGTEQQSVQSKWLCIRRLQHACSKAGSYNFTWGELPSFLPLPPSPRMSSPERCKRH